MGGPGWAGWRLGPGGFLLSVTGSHQRSLKNCSQLSVDSELEASKSKCGNLLSSGSKDSEKWSGFYELHSRLIPGPWGGVRSQA